jgi:DNA repair protein RecN (Recombination protein N)
VLEELHVAGLGVIEEEWLSFGPGLNAVTGETGAGKTMVVVALGLALGARAGQGLVRDGNASLSVEARFSIAGPSGELLEWTDGDDVIARRTLSVEGRSAARLGGHLGPVSALASVGEQLVEFHGQSQTERLASPTAQTAFLDRFAGSAHLATARSYRAAFRSWEAARTRLADLDRSARQLEREKDLLAYQVREIEAASVRHGELAELQEEESRLGSVERILELAAQAEAFLGSESGSADGVRIAAAALRTVAQLDRGAGTLAERLGSLSAEIDDVLEGLRRYREAIELDPGRLSQVRSRIQVVKDLERKYGDGEGAILAYLREAEERLRSLTGSEGEREALAAEVGSLDERVHQLADSLSQCRAAAAPRLGRQLSKELGHLGMAGADLSVRLVSPGELGPDGGERAEFLFSGGAGQTAQPLGRVASGGELSRTMLACRTVQADLDDIPTLVFDEIDAGIGGRTAVAVATRLEQLARQRQILVVTHLPQIAARADNHLVVTKQDGKATVRVVRGEERVAEVARMLSGAVGATSLAHARELLASEPAAPRRGRSRRGAVAGAGVTS